MRLLSCEVSVRFSQQVPCGVWECLFSDSIMFSARSLPGAANLRVEIVPDRQTSFVGKTTVMSVITDSDYTRAAVLRKPLALSQAGEGSSRCCCRATAGGHGQECQQEVEVKRELTHRS